MKTIFVYQDYVHNNGALFRRLTDTFGQTAVRFCDASDILQGCLDPQSVAMFVMPGGADLYYCEKLNGTGNAAIRAYVEQGGVYLGICAGAYYACSRIEWDKDGGQSICGDRELNFFHGTAIGPAYSLLENSDITKSWDNIVPLETKQGRRAALYSAGPCFVPDAQSQHTTLATYADLDGSPAGLIEVPVGQGRAILSSCHIEYTPDTYAASLYQHRNASPAWTATVAHNFAKSWTPQTDIWSEVIPGLLQSPLQMAA